MVSNRARREVLTASVFAVIVGLLLVPFMSQPMWRDEGTTFLHASQRSVTGVLESVRLGELSPPLYFLIEHIWVQVAGTSEFALRFPSLIAMSLAVGFLYDTARRVAGRVAGYATAACACIAPLSLFVGTEARPYALTLLLAALVMWLISLLLLDDRGKTAPIAGILAIAVASFCWTHYTAWPAVAGLVLVAPAIGLGSAANRRVPYLLALVAGAATTAVLIHHFALAAGASLNLEPDPAGSNLFQRLDARFVWFNPLLVAEPVFIALFLGGTAAWLVRTAQSWPRKRLSAEDQFLVACFGVVVCGVGASIARSVPTFHHLAAYAPAAWLIIGAFYAKLASWLRPRGDGRNSPPVKRIGVLSLAAITIFTFCAFPLTYLYELQPRSGSHALVRELRRLVGKDVMVIAVPDALSPSLSYDLRNDSSTRLQGIPTWSKPWYYGYVKEVSPLRKQQLMKLIDDQAKGCARVAFAVDWRWKSFDGINYDVARDIVREESTLRGIAFRREFPGTIETMDLVLLAPACSKR